jgi:hypothetical protein
VVFPESVTDLVSNRAAVRIYGLGCFSRLGIDTIASLFHS